MTNKLQTTLEYIPKERQSNIELLRIICMFCLIIAHSLGHGGILDFEGISFNKTIAVIFLPIGKICFDCFIMMSVWFLAKSEFKAERFLKLWFQIFFSSLLFLGIAKAIDIYTGITPPPIPI